MAIHIANGTRCWVIPKRNTTGVAFIKNIESIFDSSYMTGPLRPINEIIPVGISRQTQEVSTTTCFVIYWSCCVACKVYKTCVNFVSIL